MEEERWAGLENDEGGRRRWTTFLCVRARSLCSKYRHRVRTFVSPKRDEWQLSKVPAMKGDESLLTMPSRILSPFIFITTDHPLIERLAALGHSTMVTALPIFRTTARVRSVHISP